MPEAETDEGSLLDTDVSRNRWEAAIAIAPFLALGLADVLLLLFWGLDPLWGFVILPPILFISVLGWIGFRSGFIADRVDEPSEEAGPEADAPQQDSQSDAEDLA
jgi:hypothetical protein